MDDYERYLYKAWRRIADNEDDGAPVIRMERAVLRALLDLIPVPDEVNR